MPDLLPPEMMFVQTLGRFRVWLGDEEVPEGAWSREKARHLFQYMVTRHKAITARERMTADLWPGLDGERAERDFKVALNALNDALSPNRPSRSLAPYFIRQGTSYGLNPDAPRAIDFVLFEAGAAEAGAAEAGAAEAGAAERRDPKRAIELYEAALTYYQGEYLPDAIYEDWSSSLRERLATLFLVASGRLARLLLAEGRTVESILWSEKVLAEDPCWEEAYRLLMKAYTADGNRPLAIRTYGRCRQALADELGLEPMAETRRLYEEISAGATSP